MIDVRCTVTEQERAIGDSSHLEIQSHKNDNSMVIMNIHGKEHVYSAADLIVAINNATKSNRNKYPSLS